MGIDQRAKIAKKANLRRKLTRRAKHARLASMQPRQGYLYAQIARLEKSTRKQDQQMHRLALHARLANIPTPELLNASLVRPTHGRHCQLHLLVIHAFKAMKSEVGVRNVTRGLFSLRMAALSAPHVRWMTIKTAKVQHLASNAAHLDPTL